MKFSELAPLRKGDVITAERLNLLLSAIQAIRRLQVTPSQAGSFDFTPDANASLKLDVEFIRGGASLYPTIMLVNGVAGLYNVMATPVDTDEEL